jgi:nicotinate-nucleotide adenylyltransferase
MSQESKPRIGIFGGTFDPVHLGHLNLAEQCREQAGLDQVWFVPAARPPHKQDAPLTPFAQRVEMLALALAGHPAFRIEEMEKDRPGPSYTADTLAELRRRHPDAELFLVLGSDCLPDLPGWRDPGRILDLATLLVVARPHWPVWSTEQLRAALGLAADRPVRLQVVQVPLIDLSSTELRRRVAAGRSLRYLVPRAVECYIENHHLYRHPEAGRPVPDRSSPCP